MREEKFFLPKLGESITSAVIMQWFKKEGDLIDIDEPLVEVSTDKVTSELPSPYKGMVKTILAPVGEEVKVGSTLAVIEAIEEIENFYSPAVLQLAKEHSISKEELSKIPRSGERLSKKDLDKFLAQKEKTPTKEKISSIRRIIAENVSRSYREIPHAALVFEVDITSVLAIMENGRDSFLKRSGVKLSLTSFIAKAILEAIEFFPLLNAKWEGSTIAMQKDINLGIAVSVEEGVLVPVIKNAANFSFEELSKKIVHFAEKSRSGKLGIEEMEGGNITLTNFGMGGALIGLPIIPPNEAAIIGVGTIFKKVVPLEDNNRMSVRSFLNLTLSFDHRLFDGMYGCSFLAKVKSILEGYARDSSI